MHFYQLGGRGRLMRPALDFALAHGFAVDFTHKNHLIFIGYGMLKVREEAKAARRSPERPGHRARATRKAKA